MHCSSCQAQLASGATSCYFCGASQPSVSPGTPSSLLAQTGVSVGASANDGWRIWVSVILAGIYAPFASSFLLARERWSVAGPGAGAPPASPSSRGLVVLAMLFAVPLVPILSFGLVDAATAGPEHGAAWEDPGAQRRAFTYVLWTLPVGWFYLLSLVRARAVERELTIHLHDVTAGSPAAARVFGAQRFGRALATALSTVPFALSLALLLVLAISGWSMAMDGLVMAYFVAIGAAIWATSWLHIGPFQRYRNALSAGAP